MKTRLLLILLTLAVAGCTTPRMDDPSHGPIVTRDPPIKTADDAGDRFAQETETGFRDAATSPISTFSTDVNTASYAYARRMILSGMRPPKESVRLEEFINAFDYHYPEPDAGRDLGVTLEASSCPWEPSHRLVRVGVKARAGDEETRPAYNLVLLIDTSGSMAGEDRLPLAKKAFLGMIDRLDARDRIAIITYAGSSKIAMRPTRCDDDGREQLRAAVENLRATGSTNGGDGIKAAYRLVSENRRAGAVNRVILATDGDFNVGVSGTDELAELAKRESDDGIFLTVLGFGTGNLNDALMKTLSVKAHGNHHYIDSEREAARVLGHKLETTVSAAARDVKIRVDFNPAHIGAYRLLGYESRRLADNDFNDAGKDGGDMGAGQAVTALYEIIPAGAGSRYRTASRYVTGASNNDNPEWLTVKVAHRTAEGDDARVIEKAFTGACPDIRDASRDQIFAAAVTEFGLLLRESRYRGTSDFRNVDELLGMKGITRERARREFSDLNRRLMGTRN